MSLARGCAIGLSLACAALPASAQSPAPAADASAAFDGAFVPGAATPDNGGLTFGTQNRPERTIFFSVLFGAQTSPAYFGSDEMEAGPSFRAGVGYLNFAGVNFGDTALKDDPYERDSGFGYGVSFRFIKARDSDDYSELEGLDDIDPTLEIGGVVGYAWPNVEALVDTRYGIGGSDTWVSEAKMNFVARPMDGLAIRVGPRLLFGTERYVDTYFGISPEESARSGLDAYNPDGGLVSAGVEVIATYRLSERWWLEGAAKWVQFQDGAADSPIVKQGSNDSTQVRIGLRRAFTLQF